MNEKQLSTILVSKQGKGMAERNIPEKLGALGYEAKYATIPIDIMWTVNGEPHMWDIKKTSDMISSAEDGRLHTQMEAMKARKAVSFGFLLEGDTNLAMIGHRQFAWPQERFDNLLLSLQEEGARIVHSLGEGKTVARIGSLYRRSGKETVGSWHAPTPHKNLSNLYTNKVYRSQIEMLMSLPGLGEGKANDLLDRWPIAQILGITPDGLNDAQLRWKGVKGIGDKLVDNWTAYLLEDFSSVLLRAEVS